MEFTHAQRQLLDMIYEHFDNSAEWPETKFLQRRLFQLGERKLQVEAVLAPLRPEYVRNDGIVGGKVRLTLRCLRDTYRMVEVNDFICFLRAAVERYGTHRDAGDLVLTREDLRRRCSMDDRRMNRLDVLIEDEWVIAGRARRDGAGSPVDWSIRDSIWRYDDAHTIERYFELKAQYSAPNAESSAVAFVQPASFGAIPAFARFEGFTMETAPNRISAFVQDSGLHDRCEDLLRADGHFDRAVFQACLVLEERVRAAIGQPNLRGTALMEIAFTPRQPRIRLSTDEKEQRGAMELYRGLMALLRNPTGHRIVRTYSREDAQRFVVLADFLLALIANSVIEPAEPKG